MKLTAVRTAPAGTDAVAVAVAPETLADLKKQWKLTDAALAATGFAGNADQVSLFETSKGLLIAVGVGEIAAVNNKRARRFGALAVRAAGRLKKIALDRGALSKMEDQADAVQAISEGVILGSYSFSEYRSKPSKPTLTNVALLNCTVKVEKDALTRGIAIGEAQNWARTLVNRPGGDLTPAALANEARAMARREGLTIKVLNLAQIQRLGLGGLLGVNRGSTQEPRFVEITYAPPRPKGTLALVGKGITFDSGGLSIKTGEGMMTMKMDMGGAAAVLGCFSAIKAVAPKCKVVGYIPMTDNMSDGDATRPGDVLKIRNGTTVEVLNTDAEGRLILADALSLAVEAKPDAIIDLATLTGAVEIALGGKIAAIMSNSGPWQDQVLTAAGKAGERMWPLPLPVDYRTYLDSDVADLRNISRARGGGTITAGLFLEAFVPASIPWAHLDIAGTAWSDADDADVSKGGTGYGVRLLLKLAADFEPPKK